MPNTGEVWVQLATRIPKAFIASSSCIACSTDVSVMEFVVKALEEKLAREAGRSERRRARG